MPASRIPTPDGVSATSKGTVTNAQRLRGFASMDPERQRMIASLGGRAAHESGNAHEFTSEEARAAALKGHANRAPGRKSGKTK